VSNMIFVNLPVSDLAAATRFYQAIGCSRNDAFSDHQASSMVWSDTITFQLLTREYFQTFAPRPVADAHSHCAVLLALTRDTREAVDRIADAAAAGGGKADVRERMDMGWMYNRTFQDPDGHVFEAIWMDPKGIPGDEDKAA
jgi:predicted lactoylglutathione lyase